MNLRRGRHITHKLSFLISLMNMNSRGKLSIGLDGVRYRALATHSENKSLREGCHRRRRTLPYTKAFRFTLVKRGVSTKPSPIGRKRLAIILRMNL